MGEGASYTHVMVDCVAQRAFKELESDPERCVRKILDLGQQLAQGEFQQHFFKVAKEVLKQEPCPYFDLLRGLVRQADKRTLKTFAVNLGWQSWTVGTKKIRREKEALSWCMNLYPQNGGRETSWEAFYELIEKRKRQGVMVYAFLLREEGWRDLDRLSSLFTEEEDCAFLLFIPSSLLSDTLIQQLCCCHNVLILTENETPKQEKVFQKLKKCGCLCGVYQQYKRPEQVEDILSGRCMRRHSACGAPLVFFLGDESRQEETVVYDYVCQTRKRPDYPVLVIDYFRDIRYIGNIISDMAFPD